MPTVIKPLPNVHYFEKKHFFFLNLNLKSYLNAEDARKYINIAQ